MGWASGIIERLKRGETVQFRPRGNSMRGRIESGALCTVEPITDSTKLAPNDVVLCKVNGNDYLHLVKALREKAQFLIGNNHGDNNGWISRRAIFGKCIKVEK